MTGGWFVTAKTGKRLLEKSLTRTKPGVRRLCPPPGLRLTEAHHAVRLVTHQ